MKANGKRSELALNLTVLLGSVVLVLFLGEIAARLYLPAPLPWLYPQLRYRPDPDLIFTLLPGQRSFSANIPVAINQDGLRGPLVPHDKEPGEMRLLFLGDSIVFGYGVPESDTVSSRLIESLAPEYGRVRVINAGVPSYNTEQEVEYLRREGLRYSADWILLGFCWNDLSSKSGVTVDRNGMLVSEGAPEPRGWQRMMESPTGYTVRNVFKQSRLFYAFSLGLGSVGGAGTTAQATGFRSEILDGQSSRRVMEGWNRVEKSLTSLAELSRKAGSKPVVVAFPMLLSLDEAHPASSYPGRLESIANRVGLDFLDLEPVFRARYRGRESLFLPYDPDHPNAAGHALAAEAIARFLLKNSPPEARAR